MLQKASTIKDSWQNASFSKEMEGACKICIYCFDSIPVLEVDTHRYEDAVQVSWFTSFLTSPHNSGQLLDIIHSHNVNVVLAAESLDESEVDLQGNVPLILLICRQHTESNCVRISAGRERERAAISYLGGCQQGEWKGAISPQGKPRPEDAQILTHSSAWQIRRRLL